MPVRALNSVVFPAFGLPAKAIRRVATADFVVTVAGKTMLVKNEDRE
jgi:hypothetical protein